MDKTSRLVAAVRAHGIEHYDRDGWDILTECYDDAQIIRAMGTATNTAAAIANVRRTMKTLHDYRSDVCGA